MCEVVTVGKNGKPVMKRIVPFQMSRVARLARGAAPSAGSAIVIKGTPKRISSRLLALRY